MRYILVTGCNGMLGSYVVGKLIDAGYYVYGISIENEPLFSHERYCYKSIDLTKCIEVDDFFSTNDFSHIIHLAAIAHTYRGMDNSWSQYYRINTICSKTIFNCAKKFSIPVFFASTADVYGLTSGPIDERAEPKPIGAYAQSKRLAEMALEETCTNCTYLIARFAPIYTKDNKKDIYKRIYIKNPKLAYIIGKGLQYEFLSVENAADLISKWVNKPEVYKRVINISNDKRIHTKEMLLAERENGRARLVIHIPLWFAELIFKIIRVCFFWNKYLIFTVSKVCHPIEFKKSKNC